MCIALGMSRHQAVLAEMTAAREEAQRRMGSLSFAARQQLYDVAAALETLEHRILTGRESVTEEMLEQARSLVSELLGVVRQPAA